MKLADYIKGDRRGREAHDIELASQRDPLLHDALDGFDAVTGDHSPTLDRLARRIHQSAAQNARTNASELRRRRNRNWSAGVAAALLVGAVGGGVWLIDVMQNSEEAQMAQIINRSEDTDDPGRNEIASPDIVMEEESLCVEEGVQQDLKEDANTAGRRRTGAVTHEAAPMTDAVEIDLAELKKVKPSDIPATAKLTEPEEVVESATAIQDVEAALTRMDTQIPAPAFRSLDGRVVDVSTGEALPGVTIVSKADDTGTITDIAGRFSLPVGEGAKIVAQYPDYKSADVQADSSGEMLIAMVDDAAELAEVVVVGYGQQKKERIPAPAPDTEITDEFGDYLKSEEIGPELSGAYATVSFTVGDNGRPRNIDVVESSSTTAARTLRRLLHNGPDWPAEPSLKQITVNF